ncbi:hypothetical protein KY363_03495 [Candidatus Woesearchaeota archaeon]|nr:hypothetical protein [Candidatus Woesearchaeota archaeon]
MQDEEIELWYEEKKQELADRYLHSIEQGVGVDQREKHFNREMELLAKKYKSMHARLSSETRSKARRKAAIRAVVWPFVNLYRLIVFISAFVWNATRNSLKTRCGSLYFRASIFWTRNSYKMPDAMSSAARPFYYFYVKHLSGPLRTLASPFVYTGRLFAHAFNFLSDHLKSAAAATWSGLRSAVKKTIKRLSASINVVSARADALSKRYQEGYDKRLQASLDRKQARKEAKERRLKKEEPAQTALGDAADRLLDENQANV